MTCSVCLTRMDFTIFSQWWRWDNSWTPLCHMLFFLTIKEKICFVRIVSKIVLPRQQKGSGSQSWFTPKKKEGRTPFHFSFFISSFHCGLTCWLSTESHSKLLCLSPSFWSSSGSWFRFKYLCKYCMVHHSIWNYQHSSTTKTLCWLHFVLWIHKTR